MDLMLSWSALQLRSEAFRLFHQLGETCKSRHSLTRFANHSCCRKQVLNEHHLIRSGTDPHVGKIVEVRSIALFSTIELCLITPEQQNDAAWEREIGMSIYPLFSSLLELVRALLRIFLMWCLRSLNWIWHETLSNNYWKKYLLLNVVCNKFL